MSESRLNEIKNAVDIYSRRSGQYYLPLDEFHTLVIYLGCLELMKIRKSGENPFYEIGKLYADSAREFYGEQFTKENHAHVMFAIMANCDWDGIWDHLAEYFESKLGFKIDNKERSYLRLDSSYHRRYENDVFISESQVPRSIKILLLEENMIQISISPTLSNKNAVLVNSKSNFKEYLGTDPDFFFRLFFDSFGNLERLVMIRTDRNLLLEYYE